MIDVPERGQFCFFDFAAQGHRVSHQFSASVDHPGI
jgi:hypothetical protein